MAAIRMRGLVKRYGDTTVIPSLDLEIRDQEFVVFVGPSGCGKSTLLRIVAGLEPIDGGELFIGDRKVNDMPPAARDIAMVFQDYALYPHMTVRDNMGFGLEMRNTPKDEIRRRVDRAVVLLADFRPSMLFGTRRALRSVAAAEALALLGWRIVGDGGRIGLIAAGAGEPAVVRPAGGERAMTAVTGALAHAHAEALARQSTSDPPLTDTLSLARSLLPSGGHLVVASALDAPGPDFESLITALAERLSIRLLLVSDAFERTRPAGLYPYALPDGHRGTVQARRGAPPADDTVDPRLARLHACGIEGLRIDVEAGPESYAPLMERLDAVL